VVSYFYDWKDLGYVRVGSLSTGNYLQDLTRDRAADGGTWNDRIDQSRCAEQHRLTTHRVRGREERNGPRQPSRTTTRKE